MRAARWSLLLLIAAACGGGLQRLGWTEVDDLPLVEMAPIHPGEPLAVFVSGDGGWRAIDRHVAEGLHARGYGIVGLVSPRFFARRRTPQEAACALQRIVEHYTIAWHVPKVVVIGYSRGAGVVPFMVNRVTLPWRKKIELVALLGLEPTIDFQITPFASPQFPVRGEVDRLRGKRILCFYGMNEKDSLCRELPPGLAVSIAEPGSHHFAGNYDDLARTIWRWSRT